MDGEENDAERGWVDPDDRLWRHPSEIASVAAAVPAASVRSKISGPNVFAVAGLASVIGALMTAGIIAAIGGFNLHYKTVRSVERVATFVPASKTTIVGDGVAAVAQRLRPAIVEVQSDFGIKQLSGSGVAFRDDGHILTNRHMVDGASTVSVITSDGRTLAASVVGSDPDTDLAVLKVDAHMPVATLGSVSGLQVGQQVITIGSPLGLTGGPSVTECIVSALGRRFDTTDGAPLVDMIQTDKPISPVSSGGALVDAAGNVIGITTAIAVTDAGAEGVGFATPIDIARDVAEQILSTGRVVHVWLGVHGEDIEPTMAKSLGIVGGALVRDVMRDSPAWKAGLQAQDIITTVSGRRVSGIADVIVSVRTRKIGDRVKVTVWRAGKTKTVLVTLLERSAP